MISQKFPLLIKPRQNINGPLNFTPKITNQPKNTFLNEYLIDMSVKNSCFSPMGKSKNNCYQ